MKRSKKVLTLILTAIILICSLFAATSPTAVKAATVKLNKKTAVMAVGQTISLKLKKAKGKIVWKSSNKNVAAVTGKGKVTAKRKGTVAITAKNKKKTYKCKITVKPYSGLTKKCFRLEIGKTISLRQKANWKSSDYKTAKVSKNGLIQAVNPGMCEVTATVNFHRYIYIIKVPASVIIATPTQSITAVPSPVLTPPFTPVPTDFVTNTPRPTQIVTITPRPTQTVTITPNPTQTVTITPSPTQSVTVTPRPTQSVTVTPRPTQSVTVTPSPTQSVTVTPRPTQSVTVTPRPTQSVTVTPAPSYVWLSATGEKYHKIPNCGKMDPAKARQVTLNEAIQQGYPPCNNCF